MLLHTSGRRFDSRKPRIQVEMMQIDFVKRWSSGILVALTVSAGLPVRISLGHDFLLCCGFVSHRDRNRLKRILLISYVVRLLPRETLLARLGWISLAAERSSESC